MTGSSGGSGNYVYGYPDGNTSVFIPYPQYNLLPGSPRRRQRRKVCILWSSFRALIVAFLLLSLAALGYLLYPRQAEIEVQKISLNGISLHTDDGESSSIIPSVHLDVSLSLVLKITNYNFFGIAYDSVQVFFSYRGDGLGNVKSANGGIVPSRSVVMATARLDLQGTRLLNHATDIIADMSSGAVPMETVTEFSGKVEMFALHPSIDLKVYCKMLVDPKESEVMDKSCSLRPW